jgi:hypothetical protein
MIKDARKSSRRRPQPVDVHLTLKMNFGEKPAEAITVIDNRRVPMVGSIFTYRDRIVRGFAMLLVRTGLAQPKVARELFPMLKLLRGRRRS